MNSGGLPLRLAAVLSLALVFTSTARAADGRGERVSVKAVKKVTKRPPTASKKPAATTLAPATLVKQLHDMIAAFDYEGALKLARDQIRRTDLDPATRIEVLYVIASSEAILGDTDAAEEMFVTLLDEDASFTLPPDTEPKITTPFRSAQAIVAERREREREEERARLAQTVLLQGLPPKEARGGQPLLLQFRLIDPTKSVARVDLSFRRKGEPTYASMPLQPAEAELWSGEIPSDWTSSAQPYVLEYFASTTTADGQLLTSAGQPLAPLATPVAAGELRRERPFYRSPWFWGATAVGIVAAGVATYVIVHEARSIPDTDLGTVRF